MEVNNKEKPKTKKQKAIDEIASLTAGLAGTTLDLVVLTAALGGSLILFGPSAKDLYADRKYKNACQVAEWIFNKFQKLVFAKLWTVPPVKAILLELPGVSIILLLKAKNTYGNYCPNINFLKNGMDSFGW